LICFLIRTDSMSGLVGIATLILCNTYEIKI